MRRLLVAVILVSGLLTARPASAASITFESLDQGAGFFNVNILFSFSVLEEQLDLGAFDFLVSFDTAAALQSVTEGAFLRGEFDSETQTWERDTFFFTIPDVTPEGGSLSPVQLVNVLTGQVSGATGSGVLASLLFKGTSSPGLSLTQLQFLDSRGNPLDVTFVPPTTPAPIPEPSTLGLLGIGLAALARKRLRRKPQTSA